MKKRAVLRLFIVFFVCFTVIIYNVNNGLNRLAVTEEKEPLKAELNPIFEAETYEILQEKETVKEEKSKEQNNSSTAVSAEAYKGKIIEKYISPYLAPLSYDSTYMKNSTDHNIDIKSLLQAPLSFSKNQNKEPMVLIYHTHATECFLDEESEFYTENFKTRNTDNNKNMIRIGTKVAEILNANGITTLHDTTQHDNPQYTGSYSRSAKTVNSYLSKYPSIKIVLDLHRDSVSSGETDKVKLATEIEGKKAAQVMLVMGSQGGNVQNYPNWQENLKLALKLQQTMEKMYPTLARPLLLMPKSYNQGLSKGSLLIEFGTDVNTLSEAEYSAELVANSLTELIKNME